MALGKREDGDQQFDKVTERGVQETTPCVTDTKGKFLSAAE